MRKVFVFRRNDSEKGRRVFIEATLSDNGEFTACCAGPAIYWGQCLDRAQKELNINDPVMLELVRLWKAYHLNYMHAGDKEQETAVKTYTKNHTYNYDDVCNYLANKKLLIHEGYRYGSSWLKEEIPENDLKIIMDLLK